MFKIDLHTHSIDSPDGGLRAADYRRMLEQTKLDFIAVTDHNATEFARKLFGELGGKIIVGEEITAREGEVIGLYLSKTIPAGLSASETVARIREQGGLVYIPHPFETVRKGLPMKALDEIADQVDIVELHNGRAVFQNKSGQAKAWAEAHHKSVAASSDAHGKAGWSKTYSLVAEKPTCENLVELLQNATYQRGFVGPRGVLYPKWNRLKGKIGRA